MTEMNMFCCYYTQCLAFLTDVKTAEDITWDPTHTGKAQLTDTGHIPLTFTSRDLQKVGNLYLCAQWTVQRAIDVCYSF